MCTITVDIVGYTSGNLINKDYVTKRQVYETDFGKWSERLVLLTDNPDACGDFVSDGYAVSDILIGYPRTRIDHVRCRLTHR